MTESELNTRLDDLHARLDWISNTEAKAAWINGYGANGEFEGERDKLIIAAEAILDALQAVGGSPKFHPK